MDRTLSRNYENLQYLNGFGNHFESEALKNALPKGQNSPQKVAYNLIAEQLSGSAFTMPRHQNQRSWLYKIRPSASHLPFEQDNTLGKLVKNDFFNEKNLHITPNQTRFKQLPVPQVPTNFVQGLVTVAGAGDPSIKNGICIYLYAANQSMIDQSFFSSDGDLLIVPWEGEHFITTEFGKLIVKPREIVVIPRGVKFSIEVASSIRGYMVETFKGHFKLPDLGPIGANGLANPRDFQTPVAWYENTEGNYTIYNKYLGRFYKCQRQGSPYDVVAWHGNYYPYKYNLDLFCTMNSVSFDHPDPSIFTVLTCQSDEPGNAICDFVIFPPRWMVAEHTFRPPYYHRNCMSEYMGIISGQYDAKGDGFQCGGGSLHNVMEGHGPDADVYEKMSNVELQPVKYPDSDLAFMFESTFIMQACKFVYGDVVQTEEKYFEVTWQKLVANKLSQQE